MTKEERAYNYASKKNPSKFTVGEIAKHYNDGYVDGYNDAIEKACELLDNIFHDRSHHSGRGDAGEIVTYDFDSMQEFILKFRKVMEEQQ